MRALIILALVAAFHGRGYAEPSPADPWAAIDDAPAATPADVPPPTLLERRKLSQDACPSVKAPWFFRVTKHGKVNYLLGTQHIGVSFEKFPKVVHDTLAHATRVVFELAPGDHHTSDPTTDKDIDVPRVLGPDLWQHYRELVGGSFADRRRRTTALRATLALAFVYDDISAMLEREIENDARALKLPMGGLETADFQEGLLVKLFDERMLRAMVASIKDRTELRDTMMKGLRRYCDGTGVEPLFDDETRKALHDVGYSDKDLAGFENTLLYDRNAAWIPTLEELFAGEHVFVAVGAAHLQGPRSVVELLKAKGYTVTRVKP